MDQKKPGGMGNLLMGIRFTTIMKLVFRNGLGIRPVYLLRFLVMIPTSLLVEIFILVERLKYGRAIRETAIAGPPVFIIGHWRSGTTLLHQLVHLDSRFTTPSLIQTVTPEHFLFSTKYWLPIMERTMPPTRPMDAVEIGPLDPMEDEWVFLRMDVPTPLVSLFFPSHDNEFISGISEFIPEGERRAKWERCLTLFLKKITLQTGRRIILKNPFHTPRIKLLNELFPGAKFMHIVRHPFKIVPSAINMWNIVAGQNAFRSGWHDPGTEKTSEVVRWFHMSVEENRRDLQPGQFAELRYEDLEKDPVNEMRRIYEQLEIGFTPELEKNIVAFMEKKKGYKKNSFILSGQEKDTIARILSGYMEKYGYGDNPDRQASS